MVNKVQRMRSRVVKVEKAPENERGATAKGGLALIQALARKLRVWSEGRKLLPERKDPTQGFELIPVVASLVFGLLSGGRGFVATEPLREDGPLLKLLGIKRAPCAKTVENVVKYLGLETAGAGMKSLLTMLHRFVCRAVDRSQLSDLRSCFGFVPVWADGSLLEVAGKCFDSIKYKESQRGQMCVGAFVGPWLTGIDFCGEGKGEGEETYGRRLIDEAILNVLRPKKLMKRALILLDSLYGDGPTLDQLEGYREKPFYIIGVQGLKEAQRVMDEMAEVQWRDTGAQHKYGWSASGVGLAWLQCKEWPRKRLMVCRRWKKEGEMIWNYAAVVTNLSKNQRQVAGLMKERNLCFEDAIWLLYGHKQAMENQWKDLLADMGLHHPPCAKAQVNAIYYAIAGLAYNLSVGVRRLALEGSNRRMRLWRLRRDVFDLCSRAAEHGRSVTMLFIDAREHLIDQLLIAMGRIARL